MNERGEIGIIDYDDNVISHGMILSEGDSKSNHS